MRVTRRQFIYLFHPGWVQTDMGGGGADIPRRQSAEAADQDDRSASGLARKAAASGNWDKGCAACPR